MTWRKALRHLWRLALAIVLLTWFDIRFFYFYTFTMILLVLHHIDHLRAFARVESVMQEARLVAVYEKLGLTDADIREAYSTLESRADESQRRAVHDDIKIVLNR